MGARALLSIAAFLWGVGAWGVAAQTPATPSQKPALEQALNALDGEFRRIRLQYSDDRAVLSATQRAQASTRWLRSITRAWRPADPEEGRGMRESIEGMVIALRHAPAAGLGSFLDDVADDLDAKTVHCRKHGLASTQPVKVVTKRDGVTEVKGLEVLYLEKFFEVVPEAKPKKFDGFSSPATQNIVPGRYFFWARDAVDPSKAGSRKESRVGAGQPSGAIEVLAP